MIGKTCAVTILGNVKHKIDKGTQTQTERMILKAVEAGKFPYISRSVRCELIGLQAFQMLLNDILCTVC